ncbi:hypothetical protein PR002_g4940 [Phytophthora rubi]|uniref:Uncharacterized protein n=1 Tax=Phytophthora rubi TaxID=129364 RepID=A0A6A3N8C2_9STRA|nr:hypothetical protein PR002_g4940 [Phytophthora rubi]
MGMEDKIFRVLVPMEEEVVNKDGVTGFVGSTGSGSKPTALLPEEVEQILKHMGMVEPKPKIEFDIKESVKHNAYWYLQKVTKRKKRKRLARTMLVMQT